MLGKLLACSCLRTESTDLHSFHTLPGGDRLAVSDPEVMSCALSLRFWELGSIRCSHLGSKGCKGDSSGPQTALGFVCKAQLKNEKPFSLLPSPLLALHPGPEENHRAVNSWSEMDSDFHPDPHANVTLWHHFVHRARTKWMLFKTLKLEIKAKNIKYKLLLFFLFASQNGKH